MPIGHNDAITWPNLQGAFRRKNLPAVRAHLKKLAGHGVTVIRVMLEYCQGDHRYFERSVGHFHPPMVQLWDDLFALCEEEGMRILLTPFDTFWMWVRWKRNPYNCKNGGPCPAISRMMLSPETRVALKRRLEFITARWGRSGALFGWDLWNEIHPAMAENSSGPMHEFIEDLSTFLRQTEQRLHGRTHPQTVSIFGPVIVNDQVAAEAVLRHPCLDFATTHFYEEGTIDDPKNTVDAAISTGSLIRSTLARTKPNRPFFDSESGPIHTFKDKHRILPEPFDNEYFRHMQWAHFASGGAGGGMRWPNRRPHILTDGMHEAQHALAQFIPSIDWKTFQRLNWNGEAHVSDPGIQIFACGDHNQAIFWLLRKDSIGPGGRLRTDAKPLCPIVRLPFLQEGVYSVSVWDTLTGNERTVFSVSHLHSGPLEIHSPPIITDLAFAVRPSFF